MSELNMFLNWGRDEIRDVLAGLATTIAFIGLPFLVSRGFLRKVPQWTGRERLRLLFCHLCAFAVLVSLEVLFIGDFNGGYLFFTAGIQAFLLISDLSSLSKPASAHR